MSWMRRASRYFLAVVILTFVASLAYIGATQDRGASAPVATIKVMESGTERSEEISATAYQRVYRTAVEQYRQVLKERFSEELLRTLQLPDQVLDRLVTERLMQRRAEAEAIRVTDDELSEHITRIGAFQEGGRFSRPQYHRVLARAQTTPAVFEQELRSDLLRRKLQALITDGVKVSEAELRLQWDVRRDRVRAAYLLVTPDPFLAAVEVAEADLKAYYDKHAAQFTRPERRRVLVAVLPTASVPAPPVTDAQVEAAYQERRREFEQPTRVRVAHVLVRVASVGGSAAEDGAKAKAEAALQRIRGGADFAQVAREVSEDTATASRGGEVGLVAPGEVEPQFERVAFSLKEGDVAGPVRTPFGYHVIKALEIVPGSKKELREVAATIRAGLVTEGQLRLLGEKAQEAQQALLAATDFSAEARRRGLSVREVGPLARADAVEGIGRVPEATEAIFALAPSGVSGPVKVPDGYAIFRLLDQEASTLPPLDAVRGELTQAVRRQKARDAAQAKARQVAEAWRGGEDPRPMAKREALVYGEVGPFSRAEPIADKDLGSAIGSLTLTLAQGAVSGPTAGPKGFYVVKSLSRERADPGEFDRTRRELERDLVSQKRTQAWTAWIRALCAGATVEVNRAFLPEVSDGVSACGFVKSTRSSSPSRG
ncbi:MAG: peptidyl-prolyl cis-trans isomerase [Candidatus Rokuibacteriota bacterium]